VVAVGGVNNTNGMAGAANYGLPFKSVEKCYITAQQLKKLADRKQHATVVIVCGGLKGVEALGEILCRYRHSDLKIHLVENRDRLLANKPKSLDREIRNIEGNVP
jgi:NADH dehydrogenase